MLHKQLRNKLNSNIERMNEQNEKLHNENKELKAQLEQQKNKQTLTEIKKLAEREVKRAPDGETFARPENKQILQKISECEVK